jgi:hypothetical protein
LHRITDLATIITTTILRAHRLIRTM